MVSDSLDDFSPAMLARALAVMAERIDLPADLAEAILADPHFTAQAEVGIGRLGPAGARHLFDDLITTASDHLADGAVAEALSQARRSRGDMGQVVLQLTDYLPLLLVVAAAKLKISLRVGRHFSADAELSLKADLPRLRKAIQDQLPPTDPS